MRPIEVFYHFYIPGDAVASTWYWWIDQQMGLIKSSKLVDVAKINMAITMPTRWVHYNGSVFRKHKSPDQKIIVHPHGGIEVINSVHPELNFEDKVREYINLRYPFVNILNVRDHEEPNIYEGQTLRFLYNRCVDKDIDVLYFYNKGITRSAASVANWKDVLNHYLVTEWTKCVKHLENADVVGVKDLVCMDQVMSGNFWWSKSSYIKTLAPPLSAELYMGNKLDQYPGQRDYRYAFERWVMTGNPIPYHVVDTKTDHYTNYCFLEYLTNGQETP